jgi:hypothetical protein
MRHARPSCALRRRASAAQGMAVIGTPTRGPPPPAPGPGHRRALTRASCIRHRYNNLSNQSQRLIELELQPQLQLQSLLIVKHCNNSCNYNTIEISSSITIFSIHHHKIRNSQLQW